MFRNPMYQYNFYEILEVSPKATEAVIEAAYKALVKKYHPDVNAGISEHKIKLLNMAKDVLLDQAKRSEYDSIMNFDSFKHKHSGDYNSIHSLMIENEKLKNEIKVLQKKIETLKSNVANDTSVYVICTNCGTKNRVPDLSYLNLQGIKCGNCKIPFGTGNKDFEKERDLKEKAALLKKAADIEWRKIMSNINKVEYAKLENLLNKYIEAQQIYPKIYGIKTKLKILKDELMLRNSNTALMKKIIDECVEELSKFQGSKIFGLFKDDKIINNVKERLKNETALYPKLNDEKLMFNCKNCSTKNVFYVNVFIANHENIFCGRCHTKLFE